MVKHTAVDTVFSVVNYDADFANVRLSEAGCSETRFATHQSSPATRRQSGARSRLSF